MNSKRFKLIIAVLLLLLIVFVCIMPRKKYEMFDNNISSYAADSSQSLYYNTTNYKDFDTQMSQNFNTLLDFTNSMMIMKRCYAIPRVKIEEITNNLDIVPFCKETFGLYTNDFMDVEKKIFEKLLAFSDKQNTKLINGDVYILLTQQPYYRNVDGTPISLDITTINKRHNYFTPKYTDKSVVDDHPIYYEVIIIYASYKMDGSYDKCSDHFRSTMDDLDKGAYSRENQCFITCVNNDSKFCGCGTSSAESASSRSKSAAILANTKPYNSMCLGPQTQRGPPGIPDYSKPKIQPTSYYMLYIVNQNYNKVFNIKKLFDQTDKCKMLNNMPSTDPYISSIMKYN